MTAPWWSAFGPAEASVRCGEGQHRMRWTEGALLAADHADAEGESVLAALGGTTTPCIDLVRGWGANSGDLRVLAIGPRSGQDSLTITPGLLDELESPSALFGGAPASLAARRALLLHRHARHLASGGGFLVHSRSARPPFNRFKRYGWTGLRVQQDEDPASTGLLRLLALGPAFQLRLCGTVAHEWSADGQHAAERTRARPALTAALAGRFAPAAAQWLAVDPRQVEVSLHDGPGWGEIEFARSASTGTLCAKLPVSWLARIWAPGLAVVGGHLVVSVLRAAWPTAQVLAVQRPGGTPVELSLRHTGSAWSVTA